MNINAEHILVLDEWNAVDLSAYSSSPNFVGWSEGTINITASEHAKNIARVLRTCGQPVLRIDSLLYIDEDAALSNETARNLSALVQNGWVRRYDVSEWDRLAALSGKDPLDDGFRDAVIAAGFKESLIDLSNAHTIELLGCLLELLATDFVLIGHLFLYWKATQLVAYPHDQYGVGFICDDRWRGLAEKALQELGTRPQSA